MEETKIDTAPQMSVPSHHDLLTLLADARDDLDSYRGHADRWIAELEKTRESIELRSQNKNIALTKARIAALETSLKARAISRYILTKEKKAPGVTVKVWSSLVYDVDKAVEWASENDTTLLSIKKGPFNKTAKALASTKFALDFVTVEEDPKPTIDKDLGRYATPPEELIDG